MGYLPQNPAILVSSINMLLRDEEFDSLESLCYDFLSRFVRTIITIPSRRKSKPFSTMPVMSIARHKNNFDRLDTMKIDPTNMCSHLQRKLFEGEYRAIREQIESDPTLTAAVRSRQLHIYREGKKILVLAGKSAPKIIREDKLTELLSLLSHKN